MSHDHRLARAAAYGRVGRRAVLRAGSALGLSAASGLPLIGPARAQEPQKGGRLRQGLAHGSTTDSLDPASTENNFMIADNYTRHNYLTEIAPGGELVGELAESWEPSADAATWRFKLRPGVEFHNGKSVTAADVIASLNHHRGEDSTSAAKVVVEPIVEMKADGPDTVVITLASGNADFPYVVSDYHLAIMPATDDGVDWRSGVGAGGYVLQDFEPGVRAFYTRNPNYWKPNRAHFDEVELLAIIDVAARTNALTSGEVDGIDRVDLKTVHLLARNGDIRIEQTAGAQHYTFAMRTDTEPFTDNNVRLALKYAIDREAILQAVLRGYGNVGNDQPIGQSYRFHARDLEQRNYDIDKAKFHLKQAGLSSLDVRLSAAEAAYAGAVDAAVLYKEHAAPAGINIEVVREPNDGYWSNVWMTKPWSAVYWQGRPTEDWMLATAYAEGAAWNDTFWSNDRFNELLRQARAELDQAKRRDMYAQMQRLIRDEGGAVIPMFANYVFALTDRLHHEAHMATNWDLDGLRFAERWWFAED